MEEAGSKRAMFKIGPLRKAEQSSTKWRTRFKFDAISAITEKAVEAAAKIQIV